MTTAFALAFDQIIDTPVAPLPLDDEAALVADAQGGSSRAMAAIIRQYAPALRATLADRLREGFDRDEAGADLLIALTEAVHKTQPGERVAKYLGTMATRIAYDDRLHDSPISLKPTTLRVVVAALRDNNDDVAAALRAVRSPEDPRRRMSEETFYSALWALRLADGGAPIGEEASPLVNPIQATERRLDLQADVAAAFCAVDERAVAVCRHAYGFEDFDAVSDAEVAHRLGLTRPTVQRIRKRALDAMHDALCSDDEPVEHCARDDRHDGGEFVDLLAPSTLDAMAERIAA